MCVYIKSYIDYCTILHDDKYLGIKSSQIKFKRCNSRAKLGREHHYRKRNSFKPIRKKLVLSNVHILYNVKYKLSFRWKKVRKNGINFTNAKFNIFVIQCITFLMR